MLSIFFIGIALSMDAFSIALSITNFIVYSDTGIVSLCVYKSVKNI